jgi:hypothetical protein
MHPDKSFTSNNSQDSALEGLATDMDEPPEGDFLLLIHQMCTVLICKTRNEVRSLILKGGVCLLIIKCSQSSGRLDQTGCVEP